LLHEKLRGIGCLLQMNVRLCISDKITWDVEVSDFISEGERYPTGSANPS